MSCHKEHTYKIPITYHSKGMANVKVFAYRQANRQNNRQTNRRRDVQARYYMPPIFRYVAVGIKNYTGSLINRVIFLQPTQRK
jgi:hypothetical protein